MEIQEKKCSRCGEQKPLELFYKKPSAKDGKMSHCKVCADKKTRSYYNEKLRKRPILTKEEKAQKAKEWRQAYEKSDKCKKYRKEYKSRPEVRNRSVERQANKLRNDINYRISYAITQSVRHSVSKQGKSWRHILPYSPEELRIHLESQFLPGMSWKNYGRNGWHIDHILPVASFKIERIGDSEFMSCWSLSNLRPLWEGDNARKKDRIEFLC